MTLHAPQKSNFRPLNKDDTIAHCIWLVIPNFLPYVCFRIVSLPVVHVHNNSNTRFILLGHAFVRKWVLLSAPADKDEDEVWHLSIFSGTKAESFISISLTKINSFCNKYSVFLLKEEGKSKRSRGGDTPAVSKNKILTYLPLRSFPSYLVELRQR